MRFDAITRGILATLVLSTHIVFASKDTGRASLPDVDARAAVRQDATDHKKERAIPVTRLEGLVPGAKVDFDQLSGSPRVISSTESFLTDKHGQGRGVTAKAADAFAGDPHAPIKRFIQEHRELFGYGPEEVDQARVKRDYVTAHNGLRTVVWEQQVDGIGVFEGVLVSHRTKDNELANISSQFIPKPGEAAKAGTPNHAKLRQSAPISSAEALAIAARDVGENVTAADAKSLGRNDQDPERRERFAVQNLKGDSHAWLTWLPVESKSMRLCWELVFFSKFRHEMFMTLVDAETGQIWIRRTLTRHISDATYRVYTGASPTPMSPGYPAPNTTQPPAVDRQLITLSALDTNASPNGWIDDGIIETRGNNVNAYLDRNFDDLPDMPRVQGTNRVFDFPLNLAQSPSLYGSASTVQLFYMCNWYHDRLYQLGFTEAAGNFQNTNFNRGGVGGDAVLAEAQDGADLNNSDFSPTPEGIAPRIQMYIFNGPSPDRDGSLDTHIVLHEYTHGLSDRLVGGGVGLYNDQSAGMSEGWSDFYALSMMTGPDENVDGCYPMAPYCTYLLGGETQNYYYGIRRYPYSTDMLKSPLTFKDIDPAQAIPHTGVLMSPAFVFSASQADEVHNSGEVWCATLWEVRAALIKKLGGSKGSQMALQLATDGMRLSPPNPNFLEARDGIIQADRVNNGGVNYKTIWAAFAKRGMGFKATSPGSSTTSGVMESYDVADDLALTTESITGSGPVGGPFSPQSHSWQLSASGSDPVAWSAGAQASWVTLSQTSGALLPGEPLNVTAYLTPAAFSLSAGLYTNTIRFTNIATGLVQQRQFVLYTGQPDYFTEIINSTTNDLAGQSFTFTPDGSLSYYSVCRAPIDSFLTDPSTGTPLLMKDDNYVKMTLATGRKVSVYKTNSSVVYVGSNGYITFGSGSSQNDQTFTNHFWLPRVSGFLDDLDPGTNGTVRWQELSDHIAATWVDVPEYGINNTNSFQIEMFYDGRIRLSYLKMDSTFGVVGLSAGTGMPSRFLPSDFSNYRNCDAPKAWLSVRAPAGVTEGDGLLAGKGSIAMSQALPNDVSIALSSSDPGSIMVPSSVTMRAGQTNVGFDLTVLDDTVVDGTRAVTISASSPGLVSMPALVSVADNDAAMLGVILPKITDFGRQVQGAISVRPAASIDAVVRLAVSGSGASMVQVPAWAIIPAGATNATISLTVSPATNAVTSASATLTAHFDGWSDGAATMILAGAQTTNLSLSLPAFVISGNGVMTNYARMTLSNILADDLVVPLSSSDPATIAVPASITIPAGIKSVPFNLAVADLINGNKTVRISEGVTGAFSEMDIWDNQTPLPAVNPSPANNSTSNSCLVSLSWNPGLGEGTELISNGNFETGDFSGWTMQGGTNGTFSINDGALLPASRDSLTAPYAGAFSALAQRTGSGAFLMSQDVSLPSDAGVISLAWADCVRNFSGLSRSNQQFRVELRGTNEALLATLFASTNTGLGYWTWRIADVSAWRGQTVRLCFVVTAALGGLDVHLDNVSLRAANPPSTSYDLYFSSTGAAGLQLLGTTTSTNWPVMVVPVGSNFWQVTARRTGAVTSPIWRFSTVPTIFVHDIEVTEPNAGSNTIALFPVTLSAPSTRPISLSYATANGTASAGTDYVALATGTLVFNPGETNKTIPVTVLGDNLPEGDETFFLTITTATNAPLATNRAMCTIRNNDPWPGVIDHFAFSSITSPQESSNAFPVTISLFDSYGNPVTNSQTINLSAVVLGPTKPLLGDRTPIGADNFSYYTLGFAFTPSVDIAVTHARHYYGSKVSIWNENKTLLASVPVTSVPGQWIETPFPMPVQLKAGTRYRIGVYTDGQTYAWASDTFPMYLPDCVINGSYYSGFDSFPTNTASRGLYFLDFRYTASAPATLPVQPASIASVTGGIWNGLVSVPFTGTNIELRADDGLGHFTVSAPFDTIYIGPRALATQRAANALIISWPAPGDTYVLESTPTLSPANWQPVPVAPILVGSNLVVTNTLSPSNQFFRLRK